MNDTRVTARRLHGHRSTGGKVEALILGDAGGGLFQALVKPARRVRVGDRVEFAGGLTAQIEGIEPEGRRLLRLSDPGALATAGQVPLPPYIARQIADPERYQTVYGRSPGSAAAPTAGLHFTRELLGRLRSQGVETALVTLDVGLDTFRPVSAEDTSLHQMHGERCTVPPETAQAISRCRGRVVAVGTTTVRALETFAVGPRSVEPGSTVSRLLIEPPHDFRAIDGMFTNFHMPRTTMLLMVAALAGREPLMAAYEEAVRLRYRFLSFGDSMLIL